MFRMKRFTLLTFFLIGLSLTTQAQDVTSLEKIGPVVSFSKSEKGITLNCRDDSQVQLTVLAHDLIRVRASFTKPIGIKDHSWAIAKENWTTPSWNVSETAESITISTSELDLVIHRSPLLIEFRDARTHETINADEQPMAYDAKGIMAPTMPFLYRIAKGHGLRNLF